MKIKWKVGDAPTGPYRSFQKRGWPHAYYETGEMIAAIYCDDDYYPRNVKTGNHKELTLRIADHSQTPWKWRTAKHRPVTLKEAKELLITILKNNPQFCPGYKAEK